MQVPTIGKLSGCPGHKAKGGWAKKLPKSGVKTHQKYPKRGTKLINEEVTDTKQGRIQEFWLGGGGRESGLAGP